MRRNLLPRKARKNLWCLLAVHDGSPYTLCAVTGSVGLLLLYYTNSPQYIEKTFISLIAIRKYTQLVNGVPAFRKISWQYPDPSSVDTSNPINVCLQGGFQGTLPASTQEFHSFRQSYAEPQHWEVCNLSLFHCFLMKAKEIAKRLEMSECSILRELASGTFLEAKRGPGDRLYIHT